jgi:hypothetical protein
MACALDSLRWQVLCVPLPHVIFFPVGKKKQSRKCTELKTQGKPARETLLAGCCLGASQCCSHPEKLQDVSETSGGLCGQYTNIFFYNSFQVDLYHLLLQ